MPAVRIQVLDDGPLLVTGEVEIVNGEGKVIDVKSGCYLCRCGSTATVPYCNGIHEGRFSNKVR